NDPPPQPHFDHRFIVRLGLNAAVILVTGLLLIVVLGISQRIGWLRSGTSADEDSQSAAAGMIYTCPMHPQIRQPNPGRCPICSMPLELATSDGAGSQDE